MKNYKKYYLTAGIVSLITSLILSALNSDLTYINFLAGLFIGLSVPLNLYGIWLYGRYIKKQSI